MGALMYVDELLEYEQAVGKSPVTRKHHRRILGHVSNWLESHDIEEEAVRSVDLVRYINALGERVSPWEANNHVAAIRVYFKWMHEEELLPDGKNPALRLKYRTVPERPVQSLTSDEVKALVQYITRRAHRNRFGGYRTSVVALLLLDTGMRIGEALRLRLEDLDLEASRAVVLSTKTHNFRIAPLSPMMKKHLRRYLRRRTRRLSRLHVETDAVFIGENGKPADQSSTQASFRLLGELAGIRHLHPHLLRHTFATQCILNGAPLPAVMRLGGWRKLATVQRYTYINDDVAAEVHAETGPLSRAR